jgi:hypothetical protein
MALSAACAPRPSSVPLGLGPLAVAEQSAASSAERRRLSAPRPAAVPDVKGESGAKGAAPDDEKNAAASETSTKDADEPDEETEAALAPGAVPALEGLYAGNDTAIFRLTGFPEREQKDDKAKIRIEADSPSVVRITLINSEDGSDLCELTARVQGNAALLESPQPCFSSEEEGALQAELTSGRAVVSGDRLSMQAEGTLSATLADQELDGTLTYSFKGDRQ